MTGNIKYIRIIDMPHHTSKLHARMSMNDRAAQFAPFAALTGYDEKITENARLTESKEQLDEDKMNELNEKIRILSENIIDCPYVSILRFLKDERKSGGRYITINGNVRHIDDVGRVLVLKGGESIPFDDIYSIDGKIFPEKEI